MTVEAPRRSPGRPRSQRAEDGILRATLDLLASHGVRGLTIEAVAAKAGSAKTTLYRRWPNKNELILDALEYVKGPVVRPPGNSVREDLMFIMTRIRDRRGNDYADRITPKFLAEQDDYPELVELFRERIITPRREVVFEVLRRGIAEGMLRADINFDLVVDMLCAPMITCSIVRKVLYTDAELEFLIDAVLRGLKPE